MLIASPTLYTLHHRITFSGYPLTTTTMSDDLFLYFCRHHRIRKIHKFDQPPWMLAFCREILQIRQLLSIIVKITAYTIKYSMEMIDVYTTQLYLQHTTQ